MDQRNKRLAFGLWPNNRAIMQGLLSSDYDPDMIYASDRDEENYSNLPRKLEFSQGRMSP